MSNNFVFAGNTLTVGNLVVTGTTFTAAAALNVTRINMSSNLVISNTDLATSAQTGAIQVSGGIGIQGNSYFGNNITVQGTLAANTIQTTNILSSTYQNIQVNINDNNTWLGKNAMTNYSSAYPFNNSTAVGFNGLNNNTTGVFNTAIGASSLSNNTTGNNNTAIGANAGLNNVNNSNYNTFLGNNTDNTGVFSTSTAIGYNAKITASNQIVLGTATETVQIPGQLNVSGNVTVTGTVIASNFPVPSDRRLKTNVQPIVYTVLPKVMELKPCTFDWISNGTHDAGFIAQDYYQTMDSVLPDIPKIMTTTGDYTLDYNKIVVLLVKSIQELTRRVEHLESSRIKNE